MPVDWLEALFQHTYEGSKLRDSVATVENVELFQHTYEGSKLSEADAQAATHNRSSIPTRVRNNPHHEWLGTDRVPAYLRGFETSFSCEYISYDM